MYIKKCFSMMGLALLLVGCASFQPVESGDLIGVWEGVATSDADGSKMDVAFEIRPDGTFEESIKVPAVTFSGIYEVDPQNSTLSVEVTKTSDAEIVPVGTALAQDVVISEDGTTFKASGSGSTGVFHRR